MNTTYENFLHSKIEVAPVSGFQVPETALNPALKPHQRDAVLWAVKGGRRALFESFGLGKTVQELEWCRLVAQHEGGKVLIVLPLGVRQEFCRDAVELLGMEPPSYIRTMAEAEAAPGQILLTNYERVRDGDIDPGRFCGVALDEASVLRSYGSKTFQQFMILFKGVRYKLVATATPSPNRFKELIHYAGFLEVMDTGQALTRFFQRDSTKANNLTLYPHKEEEFWLWVSSWALFLSSPADLGYDAAGYDLPPLDVRVHMIQSHIGDVVGKDGQVKLMREAAVSLQDAAKEKRESVLERVRMAGEIVASDPEAHFLLWHDLEYERETILKEIPADNWAKEHNSVPFLGLMASEGGQREMGLTKNGCNYFGKETVRSCPFAVFTRQDILQLALDLDVPIPEIYGQIVRDADGMLRTTRAQRTGCTMCGFGIHLEKRPHRFDRLREDNPKEWEFWMYHCVKDPVTGEQYGWGRVLDYIGVEWENLPGQVTGQIELNL